MLLSNQLVNEDVRGNFKNCFQTYKNENTTFQNLWDAAKAILRKFIATKVNLKK